MNYVLDASVALKWVLPEADSAKTVQLRDDFRLRLLELLAPDVFPLEVAHALARADAPRPASRRIRHRQPWVGRSL
jgi:predicted nucleic acid-binding protein